MRILLPRTDEGTFLQGAARIVQGQVFGRDFMEVMGPATFYWLAGFYKIFGVNVLASRVCLFVTWLMTAFLIHRLCVGIRSSCRLLPLALIVVTSFSSIGVGISHHLDSNCLAFAAVACLDIWAKNRSYWWLLISGMFTALTALVHPPKGLLLLIAAGAWVWAQHREEHKMAQAVCAFAAGALATVALAACFFAVQGALTDVFTTTFVWPLQHYSAVNKVPYAYGTFAFNWRGVPLAGPGSYITALFACLLMVPCLYVAVLPVLLCATLAGRSRLLTPQVALLLSCGFALWLSELHRKDIVHLVFGSPLLIIAGIQLLSRAEAWLSRAFLVLLAASACALAACNGIVGLTAHPVATRVGMIALFQGGEEFAALNAYISPGEAIFAYPYCPSYYFLTQANNPTRFSLLQSGYSTSQQVDEVIHVLESRKVKHVLWDTSFNQRSLALVFPAALGMPENLLPLETYLHSHYLPVYSRNGFQILERKQNASKY